jgi:hypothetical protein
MGELRGLRLLWSTLAVAIALVLCLACGTDPPSGNVLRPSQNPVAALDIVGPREIAPGGSARFTVLAQMVGGAVRDVTRDVAWRITPPSLLSIDGTGLATAARERGDVEIVTAYESRASAINVIVLPADTYRVTGIVSEFGPPSAPLPDALVEVSAGVGSGLSARTTADGRYRLYGVSGDIELRVAKAGFTPRVTRLTVSSHLAHDVEVAPEAPRQNIAGMYQLEIAASATCRHVLREELRTRTYVAQILQSGPLVEARLSGATFSRSPGGAGDRFRGRVEPDGVSFQLTAHAYSYYSYASYPDVLERLSGAGFLVISGSATLSGSAARLSGMLNGTYQYFEADPAWGGVAKDQCDGGHSFVLTRTGP